MKRYLLILALLFNAVITYAQQSTVRAADDALIYADSMINVLPELYVVGERPLVRSRQGRLVYDMPHLLEKFPAENAYEAVSRLPGITGGNDEALSLAGRAVTIVIDGRVSNMDYEQLMMLLRSMPAERIERVEVMYAAPARYQVRGPVIDVRLHQAGGSQKFNGETYARVASYYYPEAEGRLSLLYNSDRFSTDLIYDYTFEKSMQRTWTDAVHTVNAVPWPITIDNRRRTRDNVHRFRWGAEYAFGENHILSFAYTGSYKNGHGDVTVRGTEHSDNTESQTDALHDVRLDYQTPFGLSAGVEMTYFHSPGRQTIQGTLNEERLYLYYENSQRINRWKWYLMQEHTTSGEWGINYGIHYDLSVDNSFQQTTDLSVAYSYESSLLPARSSFRRRENTFNMFGGVNKSFDKWSFDLSLALENYTNGVWKDWVFYPSVNLMYLPAPGHVWQFALSSNKVYPDYWDMINATSYLGVYSVFAGNPNLRPLQNTALSLSYILHSKYIFTAFASHNKHYFVQTLYQQPDKPEAIYKTFNMDFASQWGVQASVPVSIGSFLTSEWTFSLIEMHHKDSDFWNIPYDRRHALLFLEMATTANLGRGFQLLLDGHVHSRAIQGDYDLSSAYRLNAALRWTSPEEKWRLSLNGSDIFNSSQVNPSIDFKGQKLNNRFSNPNYGIGFSVSYRFGDYEAKEHEEVDTSRFR
ncbi:MAG: TonB-dependent receptor [Prevotellaceae bacterium]|jgi:hypothetical protein|nr:TonB-dependent receptor [Prevotellaceae bacterium]